MQSISFAVRGSRRARWSGTLLIVPILAACAVAPPLPDPSDPSAPPGAAAYRSPFEEYRRFEETPVAPWSHSNETVRQSGGQAGAFEGDMPAGGHGGHP